MSLEYSVACCSNNNVIKFCVSHVVLPKPKNNFFADEVFDGALTRDCVPFRAGSAISSMSCLPAGAVLVHRNYIHKV